MSMKVNLNQSFLDFDGSELCEEVEVCRLGQTVKEKKPVIIASELAKYLFLGAGLTSDDKGNEKYQAYILSKRIMETKTPIQLSIEECALIKKVSLAVFSAGVYGQIMDLIEGKE